MFDLLHNKEWPIGPGLIGNPVVSADMEIVPFGADTAIATFAGGRGADTTVSDGGGRKMTSAKLYVIFWGDAWKTVPGNGVSMYDVLSDVASIVKSPYLDGLREYTPFTNASLKAAYFLDGYNPPVRFTSVDANYIAWYMMAFGPIPETLETIVCVMMPPGPNNLIDASLLGQHSYTIAPHLTTVPVLWVLYGTRAGMSCTFSHELIECITDPEW